MNRLPPLPLLPVLSEGDVRGEHIPELRRIIESPGYWAFLIFHSPPAERDAAICLVGFMAWLDRLLDSDSGRESVEPAGGGES